jgi:Fe-S cluster biosynthesis and repair protein YggX
MSVVAVYLHINQSLENVFNSIYSSNNEIKYYLYNIIYGLTTQRSIKSDYLKWYFFFLKHESDGNTQWQEVTMNRYAIHNNDYDVSPDIIKKIVDNLYILIITIVTNNLKLIRQYQVLKDDIIDMNKYIDNINREKTPEQKQAWKEYFEKSAELVNENKLYLAVVERRHQLYINKQLMNLTGDFLSPDNRLLVKQAFTEYYELNKYLFHQIYVNDKLGESIPNVDAWVSEVFGYLNSFN